MENEAIWIIGTDPPCPRCDYLTRMVQDIVATEEVAAPVRHVAYTEERAKQFAASLGLEPGTAKDVARKAAVPMDWDRVYALIEDAGTGAAADREPECCPTAAAKWSPQLDEALRPCQQAAPKAGILMTPVLVVAGRLVHQGSVPERDRVASWIREAFGGAVDASGRHAVEVLGPGCPKCDQLYENVLQAASRSALSDKVRVRKRTDIAYFAEMGVTVTPALLIDGVVVSKGKSLTVEEVVEQLQPHLPDGAESKPRGV
jgi:protein-disulfide isomerase